jgi:cytochrome c oxidase subunit 2
MISSFIPVGSSYAGDIDFLIDLMFWIVGFWFILSEGVFFWLIFRFRKKDGQKAEYITGEEASQKRWITWPHFAVLFCDVFIIYFAVVTWYDVKQFLPESPDGTIGIIGQQWTWTFVHPGPDGQLGNEDDIPKVNEMHLEVGNTYHYKLESRDVLHSFSVPIFRLKQDAIPGRVITGWFQPTITGEYSIQCAEICGIGHGMMGARMFVETADQHAAWVAQESPVQLAAVAQLQAGEK